MIEDDQDYQDEEDEEAACANSPKKSAGFNLLKQLPVAGREESQKSGDSSAGCGESPCNSSNLALYKVGNLTLTLIILMFQHVLNFYGTRIPSWISFSAYQNAL